MVTLVSSYSVLAFARTRNLTGNKGERCSTMCPKAEQLAIKEHFSEARPDGYDDGLGMNYPDVGLDLYVRADRPCAFAIQETYIQMQALCSEVDAQHKPKEPF
jgi:hypothetical protein